MNPSDLLRRFSGLWDNSFLRVWQNFDYHDIHLTLTVSRAAHRDVDPRSSQLYSSGVSNNKKSTVFPKTEEKSRLLESLAVFQTLEPEELEVVAEHSAWLHCHKGEVVFGPEQDQGKGHGRVYAVYEGEVLITKSGDEKRNISLATFVKGESFGELSLFDREPGNNVALCEQDTTLLVFPLDGLAGTLFAQHPKIGAKVLSNLLAMVARRIRSTNRLIAEKTPWVEELRRQVMIDKLTGLYNAGYLEQELAQTIDQRQAGVSLLMIKPDNLKTLNDRFGHKAGDRTLQLMAAELRTLLGDGPTPVRYKGDVFTVIMPEASHEAAKQTAYTIRQAMRTIDLTELTADSASKNAGEQCLRITVSVGVACYPNGCASAAQLVEGAYRNMFVARNRGGNRIYSQRKK